MKVTSFVSVLFNGGFDFVNIVFSSPNFAMEIVHTCIVTICS